MLLPQFQIPIRGKLQNMEMTMSSMNNVPQVTNDVIRVRKGPWIHIIDAAKETDISTDELLNLIHHNEIAFIKPKQANESKIYLHRRRGKI